MINVVDRVSTYPGRVKLTRSDGTVEYVTWERADEPTVEGTPINKALFDSIKKDLGLSEITTVYVSKSGSDTLGNGTASNPYATIQRALDSLPKNLGGNVTHVNIGAGTYNEDVNLAYFTAGRITFRGETDAAVNIHSLTLLGCDLNIEYIHLTVSDGGIFVTQSGNLFSGPNTKLTVNGGDVGIYARYNARAALNGTVTVNNTTGSAVRAGATSNIYIGTLAGSGNNVGLYAGAGIITYGTSTLSAKTAYTTAAGGRIFGVSQSQTPSY